MTQIDKLDEYIEAIETERGGEEVRDAVQKSLIVLHDTYSNQAARISSFEGSALAQLDLLWTRLEAIGQEYGVDIVRSNAFTDPDAPGGLNDIKRFIREFVKLLKIASSASHLNDDLSEDFATRDEIHQAIALALPVYQITEEIKLIHSFETDRDASLPKPGTIAMTYIGDVVEATLQFVYTSYASNQGDADDRPIVCLSSTKPPETIRTGSEYLAYKTGSTSPAGLPALNNVSTMAVDTVYVINSLNETVKVIDLSISDLENAKYFIFGQLENGNYTWYNRFISPPQNETITAGMVQSSYVHMLLKKNACFHR